MDGAVASLNLGWEDLFQEGPEERLPTDDLDDGVDADTQALLMACYMAISSELRQVS